MFLGVTLFALVAILCIVVGAIALKRQRDYGNSDGGDDGFDFEAFESRDE